MFSSIPNYFYERRNGLLRATGYAGVAYFVTSYVKEQLKDVKDEVLLRRKARENLRRWFENNQQNVAFTIMALLPTIGEHIIEGMDVEGLTNDLQEKSRASRLMRNSRPASPESQPPKHTPVDTDARSDMGSSIISSAPEVGTTLGDSTQSWVDGFSLRSSRENSNGEGEPSNSLGASMIESVATSTSSQAESSASAVRRHPEHPTEVSTVSSKSKAELWREIKILTFTRTLTTLYSIVLLSLFTHIQLSILGRSKYIQSVLEQEREERMRDAMRIDISALLLGMWGNEVDDDTVQTVDPIDEETERKYLTLSWWICNIGWKDVGERVRRGVEEVFDEVPLKSKLGAIDLHRLICDVRRRVEHEVTFEGLERRINFMSTLLPPTPDSMQRILMQGGISQMSAMRASPAFDRLLEETRSLLQSPDFSIVLESCLDLATDILFRSIKDTIFIQGGSSVDENGAPLQLRLAGLLPGMARWSHLAFNGLPNELVDQLADIREVEGFSAIIYSRFENQFV
ncbi:hypothetical protein BDM02DRAFT_3153748 [Thelephora ganbajun]|uniref:Uncharacterized protein n=1 Tax=Thelephora ganbajun TaxID=370292 RepID=A0ACB6ZRV8_THEGA|nr:hypothetical protein BDM02DRAFT_3153748 [Thelephora ganbajun]